ncbi:MAG: Na-translocating system protein MpsC family protein [Solirubrobacteraceae bacterium]
MLEESDPEVDARGSETTISRPLEISNAISRLHKDFVGRGPTNSRTTIDGNLVVCLLEGGYTRAEQTLTAHDKSDVVHAGRLGLQDAMRQAMIAAVEQTTARRVYSFMSANDLEHNLQVEVFVLTPDQDEGAGRLGG